MKSESRSVVSYSPGQNTGVGSLSLLQGSSQPGDWTQVSYIEGGFFTSWATREAEEYWSGWPIHSPGDLPDPGIKLRSPALQVNSFQLSYEGNLSVAGNLKCHSLWLSLLIYTLESLCLNGELQFSQYGGDHWYKMKGSYFTFTNLKSSKKNNLWTPSLVNSHIFIKCLLYASYSQKSLPLQSLHCSKNIYVAPGMYNVYFWILHLYYLL